MYQITMGGHIIYDPRGANEIDKLIIRDHTATLGVGAAGSMAITVGHDHPELARLQPMTPGLELLEDGVTLWRGRITRNTGAFDKARRIEAEGAMAYLNDSIVPPYDFPAGYWDEPGYQEAEESGNVIAWWLGYLLEQHNAQTLPAQHIHLGAVTVTDPNNYITRSNSQASTTMATIQDKLAKSSLGGYLLMRYEPDGNYLDYLAELPLTNVQTVEYARNLLDMTDEVYGGDLYTAIQPVGADGLTIAELPDGELAGGLVKSGEIIYDPAAEEKYQSRITRLVTWDDVTEADNLQSKAALELAQVGVQLPETITCQACDLHGLDGTPSLRVGRYLRVISAPHDMSALYPLTSMTFSILAPQDATVTMGETKTYTGGQRTAMQQMAEQVSRQAERRLNEVTEETMDAVTDIIQDNQEIILQAMTDYLSKSEYETFREQLQAQLAVLSDQVTVEITRTTEQLVAQNGETVAKLQELMKYYNFTENGLLIGDSESELTLRLDNGRLSFLDRGAEVAYISDRTMYITDGRFLNSLRIGNFAFIPRENGNLSFIRVD